MFHVMNNGIGNYDQANTLLEEHHITVVSGELSCVMDQEKVKYVLEKYCYSKPSNMAGGASSEETQAEPIATEENNKFRIRISAV